MFDGLIPLALLGESLAQALVSFGKFRLNPQGLPEVLDRPIKIALGRHDPAQMVVGLRKVRFNLQSLLEVLYSLVEMALTDQSVAQVKVDFTVVWAEFHRLPVVSDRLF